MLRGTAQGRTGTALLVDGKLTKSSAEHFRDFFLPGIASVVIFLDWPFLLPCFLFSVFSDPAISLVFDLLIADSFNNKCVFLSRGKRETLQFLSREQKTPPKTF